MPISENHIIIDRFFETRAVKCFDRLTQVIKLHKHLHPPKSRNSGSNPAWKRIRSL
jgi:hypothetical protein